MYSSPISSPHLSIISTVKPLFSSPTSRFSLRSRRKIQFKPQAAVSAFAESIPNSGSRSMSLYQILRVEQTASQMEIKTAYRSLAKLYHPDTINEEDESDGLNFIEIHNAYETLSDPASRAVYDLSLAAAARSYYQRRKSIIGCPGGYYPTRTWETDQCW